MKMLKIHDDLPEVSAIGLGCMRLAGLQDEKEVDALLDGCMEQGINFFDHADIYADGEAEAIFGRAMAGRDREKMVVQTKCAIRPGCCYDFSKEYIMTSVDGCLKRLHTDYIDACVILGTS